MGRYIRYCCGFCGLQIFREAWQTRALTLASLTACPRPEHALNIQSELVLPHNCDFQLGTIGVVVVHAQHEELHDCACSCDYSCRAQPPLCIPVNHHRLSQAAQTYFGPWMWARLLDKQSDWLGLTFDQPAQLSTSPLCNYHQSTCLPA